MGGESRLAGALGAIGVAMLVHSAVLTASWRDSVKFTGEPFTYPPPPALLELLVGFVLCLYAGVQGFGPFRPISMQADCNKVVMLPDLMDFMVLHHRATALPKSMQAKFKARQI